VSGPLVLLWPVVVPEKLSGGMAAAIERRATEAGAYPAEWPAVAWLVKTMAGWRCERCEAPHGPIPRVLTVHHLDGDKDNLEHWNLAALCQRCHLQVQNRVTFYQDWPFAHTPWMAHHVADYNEWARQTPCAGPCEGGGRIGYPVIVDNHLTGEVIWTDCMDCGGTGHRPVLTLRDVVERDPASYWPTAGPA
jgi:hypothetical protein